MGLNEASEYSDPNILFVCVFIVNGDGGREVARLRDVCITRLYCIYDTIIITYMYNTYT